MNKISAIKEGLSGSGHTIWMVVTERAETGKWLWNESFDNREEAESWLKYACPGGAATSEATGRVIPV